LEGLSPAMRRRAFFFLRRERKEKKRDGSVLTVCYRSGFRGKKGKRRMSVGI